MMNEDKITDVGDIDLPYGHKATLKNVEYENGMQLLRLTFRENRRFTVLDIDAARARELGQALIDWADKQTIE